MQIRRVWMEMNLSNKYHLTEWGLATSPVGRVVGRQSKSDGGRDLSLHRYVQLFLPSADVAVPPGPPQLEHITALYLVPAGDISHAERVHSWVGCSPK